MTATLSLTEITPAVVDAINAGYVVTLPGSVLDAVEDSARGRLYHLEQHVRTSGARGRVDARSVACLGRVVVWSNDTYFQMLGAGAESVQWRVTEICMHGPDSHAARRFHDDEVLLPDTPLTVLRCDPNGARR